MTLAIFIVYIAHQIYNFVFVAGFKFAICIESLAYDLLILDVYAFGVSFHSSGVTKIVTIVIVRVQASAKDRMAVGKILVLINYTFIERHNHIWGLPILNYIVWKFATCNFPRIEFAICFS